LRREPACYARQDPINAHKIVAGLVPGRTLISPTCRDTKIGTLARLREKKDPQTAKGERYSRPSGGETPDRKPRLWDPPAQDGEEAIR